MAKRMISLFLTAFIFITGCSVSDSQKADPDKITVYTSFYPMYDFTALVGGDKVNLVNMMPSGGEVHSWEPSAADIIGLENADVFIYSGIGMEHWVEDVINTLENKDLIIVEASKNVPLLSDDDHDEHGHDHDHDEHEHTHKNEEHNHGPNDPHIWLNPLYAKIQTETIKEALIKADGENQEYYESKFQDAAKLFAELDDEYKEALDNYKGNALFVSHKAFGYLCDAYGLIQVAVSGLSDEDEPDAKTLAQIVDLAKDYEVKTIFFQKNASSKVAQTIANEIGATIDVLSHIESLSKEEIENGENYFTIMRENLEAIKKSFA